MVMAGPLDRPRGSCGQLVEQRQYRLVFDFVGREGESDLLLIDIGTQDEVY